MDEGDRLLRRLFAAQLRMREAARLLDDPRLHPLVKSRPTSAGLWLARARRHDPHGPLDGT